MKHLFVLFISVAIMGCSATSVVTMTVKEPAPVTIPTHMKLIGTVNRSLPPKLEKAIDKIEKILTAESKNLDKDGANECMNGLMGELEVMPRFGGMKMIKDNELSVKSYNTLPAPIDWKKVDEICKNYGINGLFVLEFYDTDTDINYSTEKVMVKSPFGIDVPAIEHHATVNTIIKTGWRIYDNTDNRILDEYIITERFTKSGSGINPAAAIAAIRDRKVNVNKISRSIGQAYALRIEQYESRVRRNYYVKGTENFEMAKRKAQTGNWNGASKLWKAETKNPKAKLAGRAYYNMAIINEINGNLDKAIDWAQKAYEDYNNKPALQYVKVLQNRQYKNTLLDKEKK